jgi:beta-phosphoglucomutase
MKKAVLFDLDGVLLDSMPYHVKAWQDIFKPYQVNIQPQDIYSREGTRSADLAKKLTLQYQLDLSEDELNELIKNKSKRYNEITKAGIMAGAEDLIKELKKRSVFKAIVTSTFRENLMRVMPQHIIQHFDVIITGGDVSNGKPHPEPYLKAAEKLGVYPSECVVIENARIGVESAKAAEMFCVGVTSTQTKDQLCNADLIVTNLNGILVQLDPILS